MVLRIRYWRRLRDITQQQLADRLHVAQQTIVEWEKHRQIPRSSTLPALAKALDVSIDDLFEAEANPTAISA